MRSKVVFSLLPLLFIAVLMSVMAFSWQRSLALTMASSPVVHRSKVGTDRDSATVDESVVYYGRITNKQDRAENDWRVQALYAADRVVDEAVVSPGGHYRLRPLPLHQYQLRVIDSAGQPLAVLVDEIMPASVGGNGRFLERNLIVGDPITLSTGQQHPLTIQNTGQITGVVTAADTSLPLDYVYVRAYRSDNCDPNECDCDPAFWVLADSDLTDSNGLFSLILETGSYKLKYEPTSYGGSKAYLPEYYNDKPDLGTADLVQVTAPETVKNINAALRRGGQITGLVTAVDSAQPLDDIAVTVYDSNQEYMGSVSTAVDGTYTTFGLPTGDYYLRFQPYSFSDALPYMSEYYNDKPDLNTADKIAVAAGATVSGVDAALVQGGQITGQITAEDSGQPLDDTFIWLYDSNGRYISSAYPNNTGVYTTTGLATGTYFIEVWAYGDAADYISEYYNDKMDISTADPVNVTAPNPVTGINAALARGGSINGRVTDENSGLPVKNARVWAYDSQKQFVDSESTDNNGLYSLRGLPTDMYRLHFRYTVQLVIGCSFVPATIQEYYDDKPDLNSANEIAVTAPNIVNGIDAALPIPGEFNQFVYLPAIVR